MKTRRIKLSLRATMVAVTALLALAPIGVIVSTASADERKFSEWSEVVNIGPVVNSPYIDACPTISRSGLSLYFRSDRPGGYGGFDIWVSQRDSLEDPWFPPVNLGPMINGPAGEFCTGFSPDGHWMIFVSNRPVSSGGCGGQDLWVSHRKNKRDDFGWEPPKNLGCTVNSPGNDNGPSFYEDEVTGETLLYFSSDRSGGLGGIDIYASAAVSDEQVAFSAPSLVTELSTADDDCQTTLRKDGLEIIFVSNRPGGSGLMDLWASTRESTLDPWFPPENLGPLVNTVSLEFRPALSSDGTALYFASDRLGGFGYSDIYTARRIKLEDQE